MQNEEHDKEALTKRRRWRSGTVAKREVHRLSRTSTLLLPRSSFVRVVKEVSAQNDYKVKWTKDALRALQDEAETYITHNFMRADMARNYTGKRTLSVKDLQYSHYVDKLQACQEP